MALKICLLGSIPKGDKVREGWIDWKEAYRQELSLIPEVEFVDGDEWKDETKSQELVGHDAYLIKTADVVVVNAEKKLGAGTAQEILIAKYFSKPVVSVLPKDTHHRRSNIIFDGVEIEDWIHPFILTFSDLVVEGISDSIIWITELRDNLGEKSIKDIGAIDEAIAAYLDMI